MARSGKPTSKPMPADAVEPLGTVRRSQLVATYGIGAIVDLEKGSFMPMGLEDWEAATNLPSLTIGEPRLQRMLGVSHFRLPPVAESVPPTRMVRGRHTVPAVRFPEWQECPRCHRLGTEGNPFELAPDGARLTCNRCGGVHTTPVRLVTACRKGHIADFPWIRWVHRSRPEGECGSPRLFLRSMGQSAALGDLFVECQGCTTDGKPTRQSLGDAFMSGALPGNRCRGSRPWLHDREQDCREPVLTLQRGASNVHFPVVCSTLSIPPSSEAAAQIVLECELMLSGLPDDSVHLALNGVAQRFGIAVEPLLTAYRHLRALETGGGELTELEARSEEYAALSEDRNDEPVGGVMPQFQNAVSLPPPTADGWFDLIGAVTRLREVRALAAFSRIDPHPVSADRVAEALARGLVNPISRTRRNWLPAAEILGEGIFLRFRNGAVDAWIAGNAAIQTRADLLEARAQAIASDRGYTRDYRITPRLLLVHSFSHAFIRQISVECGYAASALRERLYVSEAAAGKPAMNGVLVYTGSPDSEGSLGGLVRLADPELLAPIILRALGNAGWCGSDPVCLETDPKQSGDRLSGAACHCCLLLPETACEKANRELDRTTLAGDVDGAFEGFFRAGEAASWPF